MSELLKEDELQIKSIVHRLYNDPLCSQQLAVDAGSQLQNLLNHYHALRQENAALKAELETVKASSKALLEHELLTSHN